MTLMALLAAILVLTVGGWDILFADVPALLAQPAAQSSAPSLPDRMALRSSDAFGRDAFTSIGSRPVENIMQQEAAEQIPPTTADHSQYEILQQDFEDATDVTAACLTCHNQADEQLLATIHWTWEFEHPQTGQLLGKRHVINNSSLSIAENQAYCATCHNGYGYEDTDFDFTSPENIDCLSCHDTTGTYEKLPGAAGHPAYEPTEYPPGSGNIWEPPDLAQIAQNVGSSSRQSCGACHFGEQNIDPMIHGNLPAGLAEPGEALDVHMNAERLNFSCATCHEPQSHDFWASQYRPVTPREDVPDHLVHVTCSNCHNPELVHDNDTLNQHYDRMACQTCHIPAYAREEPTMVSWDWSQAGRLGEDGTPISERNEQGLLVYTTQEGAFTWEQEITPVYTWFTGTITYTKVGDPFDPTFDATLNAAEPVQINRFLGSYDNPNAKIWPLKRFVGIQPYDTENDYLVAVNLYGEEDSAYWTGYEWDPAIASAMEAEGVPYSGEYGFIETEWYWLLNHTVAPAEEAVSCGSCHSRDGRLALLAGSYIPGRDYSMVLDTVGWLLVGVALVGVIGHAVLRLIAYRRRQDSA
jgi:octaheme c-type cytochrome (tetrathionate reductase family)